MALQNLELPKEISKELKKQVQYNKEQAMQSKESSQRLEKPAVFLKSDVISEDTRNYALSLERKSDVILYFTELKRIAEEYGIDKQTFEDFKKACLSDFKYCKNQEKSTAGYPPWIIQTKTGTTIHEPNFIEYFKKDRDLKCINGKFYDIDGAISGGQIKQQIQCDISEYTTSNLAQKVESLYKAIEIDVNTERFRPSTTEIHVLNGILKTNGEFIPKKCFCLNRIQVEYNPNSPKPMLYLKCLHELLSEDDILTLQEYLGYCLIPSTSAQKSLTVVGSGGEGKSTVIGEPLKLLFGNSLTDGQISEISNNRFVSSELENKLVFFDDEISNAKLEDTSMLKKIITNKGEINVERKFKDRYSALLYVRFIMLGNDCLQALYDASNGFFRRQLVIKTKMKSDREDDDKLADKLKDELQGIFNWCFEGLQRLIKNNFHFTVSEASKEIVQNMKSQAFNFSDFLEDKAEYGTEYTVSIAEILHNYKIWCADNGEPALRDRTVTTYLADHARELKIHKAYIVRNNKQVRGYRGIKLIPLEKATI